MGFIREAFNSFMQAAHIETERVASRMRPHGTYSIRKYARNNTGKPTHRRQHGLFKDVFVSHTTMVYATKRRHKYLYSAARIREYGAD